MIELDSRNWTDQIASADDGMVPGGAEVIYDKPGETTPSQHALFGLQRFVRQAEVS